MPNHALHVLYFKPLQENCRVRVYGFGPRVVYAAECGQRGEFGQDLRGSYGFATRN